MTSFCWSCRSLDRGKLAKWVARRVNKCKLHLHVSPSPFLEQVPGLSLLPVCELVIVLEGTGLLLLSSIQIRHRVVHFSTFVLFILKMKGCFSTLLLVYHDNSVPPTGTLISRDSRKLTSRSNLDDLDECTTASPSTFRRARGLDLLHEEC